MGLENQPRVLVLGAYGLIGSAVARKLISDGCIVTGFRRSLNHAKQVLPNIDWVIGDLADYCDANVWDKALCDVDIVVNCCGVLQQNIHDDLDAVHYRSIEALAKVCAASETALIQISAAGVKEDASTHFMRTKAAGDKAVRNAGSDYWIFRPGLVIAPTAYGGSALLKMLAAVPYVQPVACADCAIQTIALSDLADIVSHTVKGEVPAGLECDLVEDESHRLRDIIAAYRKWLGFAPAKYEIVISGSLLKIFNELADGLGVLGWRSPLRSSATRVLQGGVLGNPDQWKKLSGRSLQSLSQTLDKTPAYVEDRAFARMTLLMPLVFSTLFIFWLFSGIIGLWQLDEAAQVLTKAGWSPSLANASVLFWSLVDLAIAFTVLIRRWAGHACWAMVSVSIFYLFSATLTMPYLWLDPLGPMMKVLPALVLALVGRAMLETR